MSSQVAPRSALRNTPMRTARNTVPGAALDTQRAWLSIMPSISVSLTMRLLRWGRSASLIRGWLTSSHVSPPSRERMHAVHLEPGVELARIARVGGHPRDPAVEAHLHVARRALSPSFRQVSPPFSLL